MASKANPISKAPSEANITTVEVVASKGSQQTNSIFDNQKLASSSNQIKKQSLSSVLLGPAPFSPVSASPAHVPVTMATTVSKQAESFAVMASNPAGNGVTSTTTTCITATAHQLASTSGADVSHSQAYSKSESVRSPSRQPITETTNLIEQDYSIKMETTTSAPSISMVTKSTDLVSSMVSRKPLIAGVNLNRQSSKRTVALSDKCKITGSFRSSSNQNSIYYNNNSTNATQTSIITMSETRSNILYKPLLQAASSSIKKNQVNRSTSISGYDMDGLIKSGN